VRSAQHRYAFEYGREPWPLQAIAASDDRQRQADAPGPMCRKGRVRQGAPERERVDHKSHRLSRERQLACLARLHADDCDHGPRRRVLDRKTVLLISR
jgi:hypothetical protein